MVGVSETYFRVLNDFFFISFLNVCKSRLLHDDVSSVVCDSVAAGQRKLYLVLQTDS